MAENGVVPREDGLSRIAADVEALLDSNSQMFLYSIDPEQRQWTAVAPGQFFHSYMILGKVKITAQHEKTILLKSLAQGIRGGGGNSIPVDCFVPRHGLRVIIGSSTNDFLICFECRSVHTFVFKHSDFPISDSPSGRFNESVDKHHLKKPK